MAVTVGDVELQELVLCCCIRSRSEESQELVFSPFDAMVLPCHGSFTQVFGQITPVFQENSQLIEWSFAKYYEASEEPASAQCLNSKVIQPC